MLSKRSLNIKPQPMFKIKNTAAALKEKGRKIISLEIGDTSSFNNSHFKNILKKNLSSKSFGYSLSAGMNELRNFISKEFTREYSKKLTNENIIISPANALISEVLISICDKGDKVLIPDPGFPTYGLSADALGVKKIFYKLSQIDDWQPDIKDIISKIKKNKKKIKAIFINTPSNPFGTLIEQSNLDSLIKVAIEHKILCIIDQTYCKLNYSDNNLKFNYSEFTFFIHSFSKSDAIPGARMGFGIGSKKIIKSIENINSLFFSSQPVFIQSSIIEYLSKKNSFSKKIKKNLISRIENCTKILSKSSKLTFVKPNGGIFMFINIEQVSKDSNKFSLKLLNKTGVCVCPGDLFGPSGKNYIRINLGGNEKNLYKGCREIVQYVNG